jgi:hypothetical protein
MIKHDQRRSLPRGNTPVPSHWQATGARPDGLARPSRGRITCLAAGPAACSGSSRKQAAPRLTDELRGPGEAEAPATVLTPDTPASSGRPRTKQTSPGTNTGSQKGAISKTPRCRVPAPPERVGQVRVLHGDRGIDHSEFPLTRTLLALDHRLARLTNMTAQAVKRIPRVKGTSFSEHPARTNSANCASGRRKSVKQVAAHMGVASYVPGRHRWTNRHWNCLLRAPLTQFPDAWTDTTRRTRS